MTGTENRAAAHSLVEMTALSKPTTGTGVRRLPCLAAACVAIAAGLCASCGGGGGDGGSPNPPTPPPPPPPPTTLTVRFVDATPESGIRYRHAYINPTQGSETEEFGGGVAAGDYDGDGFEDLFVLRGDIGNNLLYRNLGNNRFRDMSHEAGVAYTKTNGENYRHSGPAFADIDGDGDLDLFVGGIEHDPSFLFRNNGDGTFSDVTRGSGVDMIASKQTLSAAFGDYDLDGDLDMFLTHWGTPREAGASVDTEHLWRNDTTADGIRFTDVSLVSGIATEIIDPDPVGSSSGGDFDYTFTPTFARITEDRYPDLVIAADFLTSRYFVNNGDGTFANETDPNVIVDRNGMGSAVGDYDGDGDLDWFVSSIWSVPDSLGDQTFELGNRLYNNDGGLFYDVTEAAGVRDGGWGWGSCFADFDNDGDLDIYHTNGWIEPFEPSDFHEDESRFFHAHGDGTFTEEAQGAGLIDSEIGHGIVCADFDNDGDVDIFQAHLNEVNSATLWRNDTPSKNYLKVKLNGLPPNTEAAGARIRVTVDGTVQLREIQIGSNFTSQNPTVQLFGLDDADDVDSLEVEWPDGRLTNMSNVQHGQTLKINHPDLTLE